MGARDNLNFGRHIISGGQIINISCGYNMALMGFRIFDIYECD